MKTASELSGKKKAAIFLLGLGTELSANVFKHLSEEDMETLTLEIAGIKTIDNSVKELVSNEFYELFQARGYLLNGGIDYAKSILEKAIGSEKANELLNKLTVSLQVRPFDFARKTDPSQLLSFIQNEHPQTIALVMAYLTPDQASMILSALSPEKQVDVAKRIAMMDRTSPDVVREIERVLEKKISSLANQDFTTAGGLETIVEVLNRVDRNTEKTIMDVFERQDPELAEEVKKRMFVFEDIILLDDRSIQRVLREVDQKDLGLSLKSSSEEVSSKVFRNMSKRAADSLKEDIEFMGPVRLRDVEESQQKIVAIIRKLEETGEIIVARGGGDEVVV